MEIDHAGQARHAPSGLSTGAALDKVLQVSSALAGAMNSVLEGKGEVVQTTITALLAEGHLLVEDVPGVGKTLLAKTLARSIDCTVRRVQFTPDLLPSDVVGSSVWNSHDATFEFRPGPVFANLLLADEVNRASPKTQSALLESMAEEQVTVDGTTYSLARPFMVIATQNPLEHQGTFPLPESQLDRFLMRLSVGYPSPADELALLREDHHDEQLGRLRPVATAADVLAMAEAAEGVHVSEALAAYLVDLAGRSRNHPALELGMSPRASLGLLRAARVAAAADGRGFVSPDDVKRLAVPVLAHRVVLSTEAQLRGTTAADSVLELLRSTPVPS